MRVKNDAFDENWVDSRYPNALNEEQATARIDLSNPAILRGFIETCSDRQLIKLMRLVVLGEIGQMPATWSRQK